MNKCSANETAACCCVDIGTVMDNADCSASWIKQYADRQQAQQALAELTQKARAAESEPCLITSRFEEDANGVWLGADFTFCCQAEAMIFQLGLR
ncbi:hypothetical protein BL250_03675 [Erwinia sp. OLTSP20]|nr:hypothetical protein BK416_00685 [Erwinia sp. OLSSP12]PIJ83515.1 hypothetical protein BLD47_04565 [Erwinia sp. OLCASP19]PIJ86348.1 hypothetical protein BLD46_03995 [Erwinia sp. OLMTSP26]PIJ88532.1 hypothetical protein BLD49_01875 [Erwinia sp. OLMDSP33]PIJ94372.1 hypothetical protein BL250_03675 [Erwinia sp. OLTSP20]PIJ95003.1 hypothetical protein BL249_01190 [Erwinia sp. OLFS4]